MQKKNCTTKEYHVVCFCTVIICHAKDKRQQSTAQFAFAWLYHAIQCLLAQHYIAVQFDIPSEHVGRAVLLTYKNNIRNQFHSILIKIIQVHQPNIKERSTQHSQKNTHPTFIKKYPSNIHKKKRLHISTSSYKSSK